MKRKNYFSGTKWEPFVGYSRAVRIGNMIVVSGTTAIDKNGELVGEDDPYAQTIQIIKKIEKALRELGAGLENVVRTRMYVTDIGQWAEIGRAHGIFFGDIRPATTMVQVARLIDRRMLVEMEADAILPGNNS